MLRLKAIDKSLIVLIVTIIIGLGMVVILGDKVIAGSDQISQDRVKIRSAYANRERFDEIITTYQEIVREGLVEDLTVDLPTTENFLKVIEELEELGNLSGTQVVMSLGEARLTSDGFELENNSLQTVTVQTDLINYDVLEIEITVRGDYDQFQQFLNLLYQSKYYMNPTSLNITRIASDNDAFIDANMNLQIFVEKVIYTQ